MQPRRRTAALFDGIDVPATATKILIVDDEPAICEILSRWLDSEGYVCRTANSAEDALQMIESGGIELLIVDIIMPGMSGMNLLSRVKKKHRSAYKRRRRPGAPPPGDSCRGIRMVSPGKD